jgi:hypothetical protein
MSTDNLPTPEGPDWNLARALHLRGGLSHKEICDQAKVSLPALRKRIARQKWVSLREKLPPVERVSLTARSEAVRELLGADLHASAEVLRQVPISNDPKKFRERIDNVNAVVSGAEKLFQWGGMPGQFNVSLLMSMTTEPEQPETPAIPVDEVLPETAPPEPTEPSQS